MTVPGTTKKILLGMLVSNGDCLMATVIAKQIKKDFPGCHLTWAISPFCRQVIENNPDVDTTWEVNLNSKAAAFGEGWFSFRQEALSKKAAGEFDEVFFTQIYPENVHHFDGTTRGTLYGAYPHPVTVDARPVIRLREDEMNRVNDFASRHALQQYRHVILFECSSFSGQSFVTPAWAMEVSRQLVNELDDLFIILSTHEELGHIHPRITAASGITLRENAGLTRYCSLLVGCSSGITWIATTDQAKRLPMVQFLKRGIGFTFASVAYDHRYWELDDAAIIETTKKDIPFAVTLITDVLNKGVIVCKPAYHQRLRPRFISLLKYSFMFFRRGKLGRSFGVIRNFIRRNYRSKKRR